MTERAAAPVDHCLALMAQGAPAVTTTRRLARDLEERYTRYQRRQGADAWASPDILTWDTWLSRIVRASDGGRPLIMLNDAQELALWERVIRDDLEQVKIKDAVLWRHGAAAHAARRARRVFHEWRMQEMSRDAIDDDAQAFLRWQRRFERLCDTHGYMDGAVVGARLLTRLADPLPLDTPPLPSTLVMAGCAEDTPLRTALCASLTARGVELVSMTTPTHDARVVRCQALDPEDELYRAASWCRHRLLAAAADATGVTGHAADGAVGVTGHAADSAAGVTGHAGDGAVGVTGHVADDVAGVTGHAAADAAGVPGHAADDAAGVPGHIAAGATATTPHATPAVIGVVVSDLTTYRDSAARIFEQVLGGFDPETDAVAAGRLFHLSLGVPLAHCPLIAAALELLQWLSGAVDYETFSRSLRSPFLRGADQEWAARGRLDLALRKIVSARLTPRVLRTALRLSTVAPLIPPILAGMLRDLFAATDGITRARRSPAEWSAAFSEWLTIVGWPDAHDRPLNSHEHQMLAGWNDTLEHLASLGLFDTAIGARRACLRITEIASRRVFNPEAEPASVQVMGVDESVGMHFDALWVTGMSDAAWPPPSAPAPFLPVAEQRRLGMPEAAWDASLAHARDTVTRLSGAAREVVFSHPATDHDRELGVSALIADVASDEPPSPDDVLSYPAGAGAGAAVPLLEPVRDAAGPALSAAARVRGGTGLFKDHAACPFRAFARHRLGSETIPPARLALTALDHGLMVHDVLERLGATWPDCDNLAATIDGTLTRFRRRNPGVMSRAARALQRERLLDVLHRYRDTELRRPPFTVVECEQVLEQEFHGLRLRMRVDRVDRVDGGQLVVIDYKTGVATPSSWFGEHPKEPQLPLYLTLLGTRDVAGIAFACVRRGMTTQSAFTGMCDETWQAETGLSPASAIRAAHMRTLSDWSSVVAHWDATLTNLAHSIANGDAAVSPQPGACRHCDQRMFCRIDERTLWDGHTVDDTEERSEGDGG